MIHTQYPAHTKKWVAVLTVQHNDHAMHLQLVLKIEEKNLESFREPALIT
jgi:hypothetical protein